MNEFHKKDSMKTPPQRVLPVLEKMKKAYQLWRLIHERLPKTQRYTIGNRIDKLFVESIEAIVTAGFLPPAEKLPWIRSALRKNDTKQVFIQLLWETKTLDDKDYIDLATTLADVGKDLGGWNGKLTKQNSAPTSVGAKK